MPLKPSDVPQELAIYLRQTYQAKSVPEMAKQLKRANKTIYDYMEALGLSPKGREFPASHPFKRQNRKLETMFLGRKIENSNRKISR